MTQVWNKASHRNSIHMASQAQHARFALTSNMQMVSTEDGVDGAGSSEAGTDTPGSPSLASLTLSTLTSSWGRRSRASDQDKHRGPRGSRDQALVRLSNLVSTFLPSSFTLLVMMVLLLVILLLSSVYLVYRLDSVYQRMEIKIK